MTKPEAETSGTKSVPIIVQSENSSFNAGIILNETNYDMWSQIMEMHIAEKEKLSFIRGKSQPPTEKDEGYEKWYADNQKVKRWLLMSMTPDIMKRYIRLPTARDIWKALSKAFYDGADELQVFTLNQRAFSAKQNGRSLSIYYGELTEIFSELDHRDKVIMESENDVTSYYKSIQRQRVHIFLAGLDNEFEQVRGEILRKEPVPELEECYSLVRRESIRHATMNTELEKVEASAMVSRNKSNQKDRVKPNQSKKSIFKCTHCDQSGHTKDRCFELVGYPEWWDHTRDSRKRQSDKASTVAMVTTAATTDMKINGDVAAPKSSALVAMGGNGGKALNSYVPVSNSTWIIDSGATDHMTFDSRQVSPLKSLSQKFISTANGSSAPVIGEGSLSLNKTLNLDSVLVVPSLDYNLLSVSQITTTLSCVVIFWPDYCVFKDIRTRRTIGYGTKRGKLYYLDLEKHSSNKRHQALAVDGSEKKGGNSDVWLWHRRLGHTSFGYLKRLFPRLFTNLDVSSLRCEVCELAKSHRASFPSSMNKSLTPFMLIHSDVWGPSKVDSLGGSRWFVTFIDDCTRMTWVCLMKTKGEVNMLFQNFHKMISTQYNAQVKVLRSDNGGEYLSHELQQYLRTKGILHQTTCPNTPQQNGVAERKNRHLLEVIRALLIEAHMPLSYWGEALTTATYLINRLPCSTIDYQTPSEALSKMGMESMVPNLNPHIFGCVAYVHLHKQQRNKLEPRALRCVFVGYATRQKGYRCYHPPTRQMFVTFDVVFHEDSMYFPFKTDLQGESNEEVLPLDYGVHIFESIDMVENRELEGNRELEDNMDSFEKVDLEGDEPQAIEVTQAAEPKAIDAAQEVIVPNQSPSTEDVLELSRRQLPSRHNRGIPKPKYEPEISSKVKYPMSHYVSNHQLSESNQLFMNQLSTVAIPNSVQEALGDPRWKAAMNEEMKSLIKNNTWELVDCPPGKKTVGCRWVYTVKFKADGTIERFKARLVAKGYTQTYGIDYTETFAPVAKINTVRVLLSLAANLDWPLHQFDVKNAFLHGELLEEVYMDLPPGCTIPEAYSHKVCKLKKSLYGLKQSPRAWFGRFTKSMKAFGYTQSNADHTLFIKKRQDKITALIVYVDDMVVTGNDPDERKALQDYLSQEFEMKDLGSLKFFLGIEVSRSSKGIFLSQRKYTLDLLNETGMSACEPVDTPLEEGLKLFVEPNQVPVDKGRYQRLVGRLMYLAHTRPDLAYALSVVSQFMHNPGKQHMKAVMRILRYLKSAPGKGILFTKNADHLNVEAYTADHLNVEAYTDADWAGSIDDRRSTSGYFTFVGGNLVTWRSKKQNVVARSSAEAEFRGMALGLCELLWLKILLSDLGYSPTQPLRLHCDSKAACDIAHNPVQHDRTKHVEVDRFFIKEKLDEKILELPKIRSDDQLADVLTKAVSSQNFSKFIGKLGMFDIHAPT
jgi:transposase InsO family protein